MPSPLQPALLTAPPIRHNADASACLAGIVGAACTIGADASATRIIDECRRAANGIDAVAAARSSALAAVCSSAVCGDASAAIAGSGWRGPSGARDGGVLICRVGDVEHRGAAACRASREGQRHLSDGSLWTSRALGPAGPVGPGGSAVPYVIPKTPVVAVPLFTVNR
jgi:hypothetical protein